jgi:alkyl hydroperoxide reductase subunit AhpC
MLPIIFSQKQTKQSRKTGGLGKMNIPLLADMTKTMSRDYGVLLEDGEDAGVALRGLFIISDKGILRQITVNDLPVGRSVDETLRLIDVRRSVGRERSIAEVFERQKKTRDDFTHSSFCAGLPIH